MLEGIAGGKRATLTRDIRDRAILLLGAATALRRSEISALELADLHPHPQGYAIQVRRSKTDQTGKGRAVAVYRVGDEHCPVAALEHWIKIRGRAPGPIFLSLWKGGAIRGTRLPSAEISAIVKRAAKLAGIDAGGLAGHSLRSGYVTQARRLGLDWIAIMEQTGHKKIETVKRYARDPADAFVVGKAAEAVARAFAKKG
jgi:integrase